MTKSISFISSIAVIGLFLTVSCTKDTVIDSSKDYFPLKVGNYWELSYIGGTRTIDQIVNLDGKDYFRMVRVIVWPNGTTTNDTVYYRKTADGKVYQRNKTTSEILKFDLTAVKGEMWHYTTENPIYPLPWNATLQNKTDTVVVNNNTLETCYRYYFDYPQSVDEESAIWLAPGVGVVRERWTGGGPQRIAIKKARIDGILKEF
jgi:hypothetical protein